MKLLDTNAFSKLAHPKTPEEVLRRIEGYIASGEAAISAITWYEVRRGCELLLLQPDKYAQGLRMLYRMVDLLRHMPVLGLEGMTGPRMQGWLVAARLWAQARSLKPARVFSEEDLLVGATAVHHGRELVTFDKGLAEGMNLLGVKVELLEGIAP